MEHFVNKVRRYVLWDADMLRLNLVASYGRVADKSGLDTWFCREKERYATKFGSFGRIMNTNIEEGKPADSQIKRCNELYMFHEVFYINACKVRSGVI